MTTKAKAKAKEAVKAYRVCVVRDITESAVINVMARDEQDAREFALVIADQERTLHWHTDDNVPGDPYVADVEVLK